MRKENGQPYPPRTLKEMVWGVQFYYEHVLNYKFSIFNDPEFSECRRALDGQMKQLARNGFVKAPRRAQVISELQEQQLWNDDILGDSSPMQLLETMVFLLGLHLGLRACQEHRDIEFGENSQLQLVENDGSTRLVYTERQSKNKKHGIKRSRIEPKVVSILPNERDPRKCVIRLYQKYISHRCVRFRSLTFIKFLFK